MLQTMQPPAPSQPAPSRPSFAGLLATLARPQPDTRADGPLWNSSDFGEDVATLSYERALRTHARYRPANRAPDRTPDRDLNRDLNRDLDRDLDRDLAQAGPFPTQPDGAESHPHGDAGIGKDVAGSGVAASAAVAIDASPGLETSATRDRNLRSASVTIRMSEVECARLHRRAAEAGLTVSAYLRSCAVEAETLRAQVKQALAELKTENKPPHRAKNALWASRERAKEPTDPAGRKGQRRSFFDWIKWIARRGR